MGFGVRCGSGQRGRAIAVLTQVAVGDLLDVAASLLGMGCLRNVEAVVAGMGAVLGAGLIGSGRWSLGVASSLKVGDDHHPIGQHAEADHGHDRYEERIQPRQPVCDNSNCINAATGQPLPRSNTAITATESASSPHIFLAT